MLQQHAAQQRQFAALDLQRQVFYARLDQELHSSHGQPPNDLVERLMAETLSFPPVRGTAPQVRGKIGSDLAAQRLQSWHALRCNL